MNRLVQRFAALDKRVAQMALAALCFLALFEAWIVLRGPINELRSLSATHRSLLAKSQRQSGNQADIDRVTAEIERSEQQLAGGSPGREHQAVPRLITALDATAASHQISLGTVRPPVDRPIGGFIETTYSVEASGDYRAMFDWIQQTLPVVQPLIATEYSIKSLDEGRRVTLSLRLAAYRSAVPNKAAK